MRRQPTGACGRCDDCYNCRNCWRYDSHWEDRAHHGRTRLAAPRDQRRESKSARRRDIREFPAGRSRSDEAERVLKEVIRQHGPSTETCGILGRVYKDRWERARDQGDTVAADGHLEEAIETYLRGFQSDWREHYPGVNCVTLMEIREPPDCRRAELLPVVAYSVKRRLATVEADYWDHATLLELAVLERHEEAARTALRKAVARIREPWEVDTTVRNLRLINEARERRGELMKWQREVEEEPSRRVPASG